MKAALLAVLALSGCLSAGFESARRRPEALISAWSPHSKLLAESLIERYGPPDGFSRNALGWKDRTPWARIVVFDGGDDALRQSVAYRVPEEKRGEVAAFNRGVLVSDDGRELTARSHDERFNVLALNLADEVIRGARDPADAQRFYDRTAELALAGKSSAYLEGLMFLPR
jgi:hypothetical protein